MNPAIAMLAGVALQAVSPPAPPATTPEVKPIQASKIVLVGDSTTAVAGGWGGAFCADHVTSFVACVNLARGGRSSGSYIAEGSWTLALAEMRTPGFVRTWVLIQFGHNDQPGKPGRSTDLATEFPANLRRYIVEARAAGAIPVLLTPLTRRTFVAGKLVRDLEPWAASIRGVARAMNVPLVDLNATSSAAIEAMGEVEADTLAQLPKGAPPTGAPPTTPSRETDDQPFAHRKLAFDRTHLGRKGADYFATMVARGLATAVPDTRPLLFDR